MRYLLDEYHYSEVPTPQKKYKKEALLKFYRSELLYDIENYAFIEADVTDPKNSKGEHTKHMIYDIAQDGNIDKVTRAMDMAFAICVEALYPFSRYEVADSNDRDDILKESPVYLLSLMLPDDFSKTTLNLLVKLIHEFIICYVLWDWLSVVNPQASVLYGSKVKDLEGEIKSIKARRMDKVRRRLDIF